MDTLVLPNELVSSLGSEVKEFAVLAKRTQPLKKSLLAVLTGIFMTAFVSIFVYVFFVPLLKGEEVHFEVNDTPTVASLDNLGPIVVPGLIIGFFVLLSLFTLLISIYQVFQKGGYFVGTPTRLIQFRKQQLRSIDWDQFTGDITVSGNEQKGTIALQMRTGHTISKRKGPDRFVPDVIYITDIPNVYAVEQICRKRIKENDPTPAVVESTTE